LLCVLTAGDVHLEGVASYKLGLAYEKSRESEAAFKVSPMSLTEYFY